MEEYPRVQTSKTAFLHFSPTRETRGDMATVDTERAGKGLDKLTKAAEMSAERLKGIRLDNWLPCVFTSRQSTPSKVQPQFNLITGAVEGCQLSLGDYNVSNQS